jgi:hypothetical protein
MYDWGLEVWGKKGRRRDTELGMLGTPSGTPMRESAAFFGAEKKKQWD